MHSEVLTDIEIDRPRSEVADYVSNPENATTWYQNINKGRVEVSQATLGRIGGRFRGRVHGSDVRVHIPGH
jgi:hypothetical protein